MKLKIHSVSELERAIERIVGEFCQKAVADVVTFHYYDETHDRLILPVGVGLKHPERFKSWLPSMDRVAGKIVRTGEPIFAEDAEHHLETAGPFVFAEGVKSSAGFRLNAKSGEIIGTLFFNYRTPHSFPASERERLKALAAEVADAIHHLLTPDLKAQLASHPGLPREETALQSVADSIAKALGDVAVAIWTPEREGQTLVIRSCAGPTGKFVQGTGLHLTEPSAVTDTFKTGKPSAARIDDEPVFKDEARVTRWQGVSAFPVLSGSRVLGVCCIWTVGYHGLTERQKTVVRAFVELAARTIEGERVISTLHVLQNVGARLTFMLADPPKLLSEIVRSAAQVMGADNITLHQYDPDREQFCDVDKSVTYRAPQPLQRPREEGGASAHVRDYGYVIIEDMDKLDEAQKELAWTRHVMEAGVKAYLGIRLRANEATLGVLFFNYLQPRNFLPDEIAVAEMFAHSASVAIHNSRLYEASLQKVERFTLVREVAATVSSTLDLSKIWQLAVDGLARVIGVSQCALAIFDEVGEYTDVRAEYLEPGCVSAMGERIPLRNNPSIDRILETKQPLIIDDALTDPLLAGIKDIMKRRRTQSLMIVPIVLDDKVVGTIGLDAVGQKRRFTKEEAQLAQIVADETAAAIKNAESYERIQALNVIGQALTSGIRLRQDEILELIYEQASRVMPMDNSYIALYDEVTDTVRFGLAMQQGKRLPDEYFLPGSDSGWAPRSSGAGRTEEIIHTQQPIFHPTKAEAEAWYAQAGHEEYIDQISASWIGVPMMIGQKVLGVIVAHHPDQDYAFDENDLQVLLTLASQAAVALDSANLYYKINQRLVTLNEVGHVLTSGLRLRQDEILELIFKQASRLMDTHLMYIALYDEDKEEVSFGLALEQGKRVEVGQGTWAPRKAGKGATEFIIRSKKPLFLRTAQEAREWYAQPEQQDYYRTDIPERFGYLGVPMMVGERVLGVIAVRSWEFDNIYDEDDLATLSTIASQAAIALDNAQLYFGRVQELEGLYDLATAIAQESDRRRLLNTIVTKTAQLLEADTVTVCPYDPETGEFDLPAAVHDDQPQPRPRRDGTTAKIIKSGKIVWANDTQSHELWRESEFVQKRGVKSCAAVPLVVEDQPVGVLFLNYFRPHHFEEFELHLFQAIGDHAALAVARAGLQAKRLQRLYDQNALVSDIVRERGVYEDPATYVEHVLKQTMEWIPQVTGATYQSFDPSEQVLTLIVSCPQATVRAYARITIEEGVSGEAIRERDVVYYPDVSACPGYLPLFAETASELAVPLMYDGEPFGVLNFESTHKDAFGPHDVELLKKVADVAAPAVYDKFRSYELHQEQSRREAEMVRARIARAAVHAVGNRASKIEIYADDLLRELDLSDEDHQRLERILEHASGINDLISDLVGSIRPSELVDVRQAVLDAVNFADMEEGIQLINEVQEELPPVHLERNEFCTTIVELITNAQKVMAGIGHEGWIKIRAEITSDGKWLDILVSNDGPPIPPEDWEAIFSGEYYPSDRRPYRPGTRKGLFLARDFLNRYGGTLKVIRSDSEATVFQMRLPVATKIEGERHSEGGVNNEQ